MTLVALPAGGQQPSTSGPQCRNGGNRMAGVTSSSKPEMYSRGVQTGFPHAPQNDELPICICGQAAEGTCWCESLGILKELEACKLALQKGCRPSRVAILLSIHEEFCRTARGDTIINTRRRGSAHGDIRMRRSKVAPPPTLPRPRAQSLIVRNSRALNKANELRQQQNTSGNIAQKGQGDCVRPKVLEQPPVKQTLDRSSKLDIRTKAILKQEVGKGDKCLDESSPKCVTTQPEKTNPKPNPESGIDNSSYVSKARLVFLGVQNKSRGNNVRPTKSGSKDIELCKETVANNVITHQRVTSRSDPIKNQTSQSKTSDNVNRVQGHHVQTDINAKRAESLEGRQESARLSCDEAAVAARAPSLVEGACSPGWKSDSQDRSVKDSECVGSSVERSPVDTCLNTPGQYESERNVAREQKKEETSLLGNSRVPSPLPLNSVTDGRMREESVRAESADAEVFLEKVEERAQSNRLSCRDSGIGDDVSLSDVRLCASQDIIVEDKTEDSHQISHSESEDLTNQRVSCVENSQERNDDVGTECNISPEQGNNSPAKLKEAPEAVKDRPVSDATLQTDEEPLLGACAMFGLTDDSATLAIKEPEVTLDALALRLSEESPCKRTDAESPDGEAKQETDPAQRSFMSSAFFIRKPDTRFKSEHCLYVLDGEVRAEKPCKQVYLSGANIRLATDQKFVSSLDVNPPLDQSKEIQNLDEVDAPVEETCPKKGNRRSRELKPRRPLNPLKVGTLRYLISQSPLVLCEPSDSDYEESDSESDEPCVASNEDIFAVMPVDIVAKIFKYLDTRDLAHLKCTCKDFEWLINTFNIKGQDSKWVEMDSYRNDPCMQCGKIRDPWGDVSLCCWHPKIYYRNGHIGRRYWTCCLNTDEDAMGCMIGLHDNNWTTSNVTMKSIPKPWRSRMWHLCSRKDVCWPDL
ncbi:uncharacterized protein [Diadema antillarum]|uniref:uncharacterized protein n=1 Tax=Diadema antillarum TaxID=105358 RepID=UPI003A888AAE